MSHELMSLSVRQLKQAIAIKEKIEALQDELNAVLGAPPEKVAAAAVVEPPAKKRKMSNAGRAAISRAAKLRWAAFRAGKGSGPGAASKAAKKPKISAAGRRRISEAQKARWAKLKAQKAAAR